MPPLPQHLVRPLLLYEWRHGTRAPAATTNIVTTLGEDAAPLRAAERWFARFAKGDTSLEDAPRSGRPLTVDEDELRRLIVANPEWTTGELASALGCSHPNIQHHLRKLGYRKVLARWIPTV